VRWQQQSRACKSYLVLVYLAAGPLAYLCFKTNNEFSPQWLLFTAVSVFVATISVRLPKISSIISMGDVFIIFILMRFGPGATLITYWIDVVVATVASLLRKHGLQLSGRIYIHRWAFNVACCALSTWTMYTVYTVARNSPLPYPVNLLAALLSIALGWFLVNTCTLSLALAFWMNKTFFSVWREGILLCLLNFLGSAAGAGLIYLFYERVGFLVLVLSIPLTVVLYQLYRFYLERYERAQEHISELNKVYLQTVEALASAVDAKDRYTHGHIRRVQAYAAELARLLGVTDETQLMAVRAGALLHDIGKIAIPEYILNKPTVLTETEYEKMKIHPIVGANMLSTVDFPYALVPMVRWHHERWDGKGYPDGLKGEDIPLNARILSLVDCYDALTTNRPYRSPMPREELIKFFKREAGRSYDPRVVDIFLQHLEQIEVSGRIPMPESADIWGIRETPVQMPTGLRPLERVEPTVNYKKALSGDAEVQRELYSIFEFVRADFLSLSSTDVFSFMGRRLESLIAFDAGAFYEADLHSGVVTAVHTAGRCGEDLKGLTLVLEQKLSGWVAANNQALCNLAPFPDFLNSPNPLRDFQTCAIAPMNRENRVFGAISLYRTNLTNFTDQEFRRLEIVASQTAILLARCAEQFQGDELLVDKLTALPNGFQLYFMFGQVAMDAVRYEYGLALFSISLDDVADVRRSWGHLNQDAAISTTAEYLKGQVRDSDVLVRHVFDSFVLVSPKTSPEEAERFKSHIQNELDHFRLPIRPTIEVPLRVSVGIAMFPVDGSDLAALLFAAELRMKQDRELRLAVRREVRTTLLF